MLGHPQLGRATGESPELATRSADLQPQSVQRALGVASLPSQALDLPRVHLSVSHQCAGLLQQTRAIGHPALLGVTQCLDTLVRALEILLVIRDRESSRVVPISQIVELLTRLVECGLGDPGMASLPGVVSQPLSSRGARDVAFD